MSAHGSGAVDLSLDTDQDVLHVDMGGGTTKLAWISGGFVEETNSINVGARLVAVYDDGRISRLEESARDVAADLSVGDQLGDARRRELARATGYWEMH